jgi:hypothetical protein
MKSYNYKIRKHFLNDNPLEVDASIQTGDDEDSIESIRTEILKTISRTLNNSNDKYLFKIELIDESIKESNYIISDNIG